ncbi:Fungal Zn(2)-Cys(6) binuclear cluster domain-containing protein [Penicillium ucsense]|uniref:Fungal Zn(2)-Cys(6) binuclear cluster domain-containing protein n=1 Tax=Penicillium ucsense TaxID=2839758 RepID=A0A8J8W627_9EURO|nr:Fungal Zn(2)-Cys(6) binuclear cluster domain-containing protein [Penicillium ucsense]KAF7736946.1 Fungal Zn(2)-Cys(6) binuclear cluster domain-containing protein [Penicillium ucsense]
MDIRTTRRLNGQPSRARIACLHCRARKVRCTLAIQGPPCTNCQLDGLQCATRPKLRRRIPATTSQGENVSSSRLKHEPTVQRYDFGVPEGLPRYQSQRLLTCDLNGMNIFGGPTNDSGDHEAQVPDTLLGIASCCDSISPNREVLFTSHPYLRAPKLRRLNLSDQSFLESQKCLHVPAGVILETLITRYFLYVHPCLPVINEAEFWAMIGDQSSSDSSFSLLVFQAMIFAACSYISLDDAKTWGAGSILEMRNSFYRRAKLLYDFGVEEDHLRISQALTLLTYQSSGTDHLSNSTWLGLAIQQARLANAHLYYRCPPRAKYKRSDLKRLWWCMIIRDRIISLGMRRPLQILPKQFDVMTRDPLEVDDLSDEIHTSRVYDADTKRVLCRIMTSLCQLVASLTSLIDALYPLDPFPDCHASQGASIASIDDIQARLKHWQSYQMLPLSSEDYSVHKSVAFFKQLNALYFESARLALYQYISFRIHRNQRPDDWPDLMDAVSAIHDVVKRFVADGTASHLPISAVAYTALPQMVLNLNFRLSNDAVTRRRQELVLRNYMELNRQYGLRYDVAHVSVWVNRIVRLFEVSLSPIKPQLADLARQERVFPGKDCLYLLKLEPELYFKIAGMMDASMATGQLALEFSESNFDSPDLAMSLFQNECQRAADSPLAMLSEPSGVIQSIEDDGDETECDSTSIDLSSIELLSRGLGLFGE